MKNLKAQNYACHKGINEGRVILHSDLNNFFASVECNENHHLKKFPVAVCGNKEERHGIVLAKNNIAKAYGIKTGQAIWQAKQLCRSLVCVLPNYSLYIKYAGIVKKIYCDYSSNVESFGIDEAWIDLSGNTGVYGLSDGMRIAQEIRMRIKQETGLTVSIGVSDNKVFAKLASDYKKPDAVTVFGPDNYESVVCNLDVCELLYIGSRTCEKLNSYGIHTIGNLAQSDEMFLKSVFGKNGAMLHDFACGHDTSDVQNVRGQRQIKSVGNSTTPVRSMMNTEDVRIICYMLCEKVAYRLRESFVMGKTVCIYVRDENLESFERFTSLSCVTDNCSVIAQAAMSLFERSYRFGAALRSFGVRVTDLQSTPPFCQMSLYDDVTKLEKKSAIDKASDSLRKRFGNDIIKRAVVMSDNSLFDYKAGIKESIAFNYHS